ncbi:MAG TPA: type II toxin-antitoxin system prevent-host-death family antitoxin [Microbacterium sp.]|nr:type II toxin-antitoxin system prevent-host-death family antitoxin [Microbacterium sp.]
MARTIPHRELRNNSSRILEEVRLGETIHITNHGKIVATLVPPQSAPPPLQVYPATNPGGWRDIVPVPSPSGLTTQEILDALREERL